MSEIQWGLLDPNSFQRGMAQGRAPFDEYEQRQRQSRIDDERRQRQQTQDQEAALEKHRESIIQGAKIIRQIQPTDDATWQQALATAQQLGIPLNGVPQQFDPQYVKSMIAAADALSPDRPAAQPNIQKEVDYYRSIGRPELADQLLQHHAEGPPVMVDNGDGTKTLYPRAALSGQPQGGPQGAVPPPPPGFVIEDDGGPAPQAPGGFL